MKRALLPVLIGFIALVLVILIAVGWIGSERALHPAYRPYKWSLATYPDLHPESIQVQTSDGVTLYGRFFPGTKSSLVILISGYGDTQEQMLPIGEFLHQTGFNVLTYNSRSRAGSGGNDVTLGVHEQDDLVSIVTYAATRKDVDKNRIGVLGISMGGAVAVLAAAKDNQIRAVVDDSGFSDAPRVIAASFEHFIHLPAFPFAPVTIAIANLRAGINVNRVRPVDVIGEISPRPILIIHETGDAVVPPANSERNFAAARQPKQLWLLPGTEHGNAHGNDKAEYEEKVNNFFEAAFQ